MGPGSFDRIGVVYLHQRNKRAKVSQLSQGSECGSQPLGDTTIPGRDTV